MPNARQTLFRFGTFEADPLTGELRKQGRRLPLQDQPFEILLMLLERPGELVTRGEICQRLWPDGTFVDFDHSLNTAVNKIRDVLGDSAANPRFVETLARRGYRFVAPVTVVNGKSDEIRPATADQTAPSFDGRENPTALAAALENACNHKPASTILTSPSELPQASHHLVRLLFFLLQLMYFCFYVVSLARLHEVEEIVGAYASHPLGVIVILIVTAVVGIPTRLYLISAVAFHAPGLRDKFLHLFPFLFPLDEIWALAPFLLLPWIGYGLALGSTAILLYVPFAERSLILMGAGRHAKGQAIGS